MLILEYIEQYYSTVLVLLLHTPGLVHSFHLPVVENDMYIYGCLVPM
jgi:hypothetical protein